MGNNNEVYSVNEKGANGISNIHPKNEHIVNQAKIEAKKSPELKETISSVQQKLDELKKSIENGSFNVEFAKKLLEELKTVDNKYKSSVLGMVLSGINHLGVGIKMINGNKITLTAPIGEKNDEICNNFQDLLNDGLKNGDFTMNDFYESLAFRTSLIDEESLSDEKDLEKKSNDDYFSKLLKKHKMEIKKSKNESIRDYIKNLTPENYTKFKSDISNYVIDNQADREFILAYLDAAYMNSSKNLGGNFVEKYKKINKDITNNAIQEINKLSEEEKIKLGLDSSDKLNQKIERMKLDPAGFIKEESNNKSTMGFVVLFGILGAIFGGWKGMIGGGLLGFAGGAYGGEALGLAGDFINNKGKEQQKVNNKTQNNNVSGDFAQIDLGNDTNNNAYGDLLKNENFLKQNSNLLYIFDDQKDEAIIIQEFKKAGIDASTESQRNNYKSLFEKIKKEREVIIGKPESKENIGDYLKRRNKITTQNENNIDTSKSKIDTINITKDDIQNSFNNFKLNIQDFEKSETFLGGLSKEKKQQNKEKLYKDYVSLKGKIIDFESKDNLTQEDKNFINKIKLYLANYFADKLDGDEENDFNKNYQLSSNLALEMLPPKAGNIEKPTLNLLNQNEVDLEVAKTISGQKGLGSYNSKELTDYIVGEVQKGRKIEGILLDEKVNDTIVEIKGGIVKKYESDLEKYLDNLNDDNLTEEQLNAKELVSDIYGFGSLDIKEINWDITKQAGGTIAAIGAGIGTGFGAGALAGAITGPGALATGIIGAIAGGITTTAGIMMANGDDYSEDWGDGAKELAINTATFGAGGLVFKGARFIQGGNKLISMRGLGALGAEMAGDVGIGMGNDLTRYDVSFGEAFANNIYWGLLPLGIAGAGKIKGAFSRERQELGEYILTQAKGADFLIALGKYDEAKSLLRKLTEKITRVRSYSEDTQNLLKPLKNNLDEIRALKEGESLTLKNGEKVTLKNGNYVFYGRFDNFINNNKGKLGCEYFNNNEKLLIDIDASGKVTKIVKENGIEINLQADIKRYIGQKMDEVIPKQVIDESIKGFYIKSQISSEIKEKLVKTGDTFNIGGAIITKVEDGYMISGNNTIYKKIDDILNNPLLIKPENFIKYGQNTIDTQLKARISNLKFESNGKKYSIVKENGESFLYEADGKNWKKIDNINSGEAKKIIDENYEQLFKLNNKVDLVEKSKTVLFDYRNMKLGEFIKKHGSNFGDWMSVKKHSVYFNMTIGEILTLPKVVVQISKSGHGVLFEKGKRLSNAGDILKALAYGDKDRTLLDGVLRATTVGVLVSSDGIVDNNDSEFIDALQYQYGGIMAEGLYTLLSNDE